MTRLNGNYPMEKRCIQVMHAINMMQLSDQPIWCSGVALLTGRLQAGYMQVSGRVQAGQNLEDIQTVRVKPSSMSGNAKSTPSHNFALHHSSNLAVACSSS